MSDKSEYQLDLEVNRDRLDEEWEDQPQLYMKWAERLVEAIYERDRAKEKLDFVKANIDSKIRANPRDFGFDKKPTESAILNKIIVDDEYQQVLEVYLKTKRSVGILQGVKEAMEHKKKAIEGEVTLWVGEYFSEPRVSGTVKEKSSREVTEKIRRRLLPKREN